MKGMSILVAAAPLRVPVNNGKENEFFEVLIEYLDDMNPLRIILDSFGPAQTAQFLSLFHGYTITVQSRKFWTRSFRNIHVYLELFPIVKAKDQVKWRATVLHLAGLYSLHPTNIVAIYQSVRDRLKGKRKTYGTAKHPAHAQAATKSLPPVPREESEAQATVEDPR